MIFNNYNHFKSYCLKIAVNHGYEVSEKEKEIINEFKNVCIFIESLREEKVVYFEGYILSIVCDIFKSKCFKDVFRKMDYLNRKNNNFKNNEMYDIYYIITSLNSMLHMDITLSESFVIGETKYSNLCATSVKVICLYECTDRAYAVKNIDFSYLNKFGIYVIYDSNNVIAYIGKSTSCILSRSIRSAQDRKLNNFSKIELLECKSKSDTGVYEPYLISKYKPRENKEFVYEDCLSIELPKLEVSKTIERDVNSEYIEYNYKYMKVRTMSVEDFLIEKDKKEMYIYSSENINKLRDIGICDKQDANQKAYQKAICENKNVFLMN